MSLIKCPECGNDVSDSAQSCPKCGYPIKKDNDENMSIVSVSGKSKRKNFNRWLLEIKAEENRGLAEGMFFAGDEVSLLDKDSKEICKHKLDTYCFLKIGQGVFNFGFNNIDDEIIVRTESIGKIIPNIQIQSKKESDVKCPKCGSTQIQIVPRRWSLATGFLTNKVDRVCINCKTRF